MAYETLVAVYDVPAHATAAVAALKAAGFAASDISVFDSDRLHSTPTVRDRVVMWQKLFGADVYQHEAAVYTDAIEHGGAVIAVRVPDNEVAHATAILNMHRAVDVHDRAVTSGAGAAAHIEAVKAKLAALRLTEGQRVGVSDRLAAAHPDVLQLAEEQLEVGRAITETGRTRIRRFVTEKDVEANVTLHDEHAEVIRTAIANPRDLAAVDWADETIEVVETAEHALVNKTARVVEEVQLRKVGTEHVETIHDKLRRQQVEIERLGPDGKPLPPTSDTVRTR